MPKRDLVGVLFAVEPARPVPDIDLLSGVLGRRRADVSALSAQPGVRRSRVDDESDWPRDLSTRRQAEGQTPTDLVVGANTDVGDVAPPANV